MNPFTKHPNSINETYLQHFRFAFSTGCKLIVCGICGVIHAVFPFMFTDAISKRARWLHETMGGRIQEIHEDREKEENLDGLF